MRHVLVVDDEPAICEVVQMALELDGTCRVTSASAAAEALAVIDEDRPDVAIIDAALPRISGLALARGMVDLGVPVLIISGEPEHQRLLSGIHCPFLAKPFSLTRILTETRLLLDKATQRMAQLAGSLDRLARNKQALAETIAEARRLVECSRAERAARQSRDGGG